MRLTNGLRDESKIAYDLVVTGRVQGVGYRFFIREEARRIGVVDTVRNRDDGSVEAHVEATKAELDRIVAAARRGPSSARVDSVAVRPVVVKNDDDDFRVVH